jgi:CRISPR-associated protein Cmr1
VPEGVSLPPGTMTEIYRIQLITPIFGGGIKAGENDPVTLIRPSSIRGHLRFWWRATRGASCADAAELGQREGAIWGTPDEPSKVALEAMVISQGPTYPCAYFPEGRAFPRFEKTHPPYALFPFQGNARKGEDPARCTSDVIFDLKLTYPVAVSKDVNAALWSWVNFGGVGARTRRGCGALYCKKLSPPDCASLASWYEKSLKEFDIDLSQGQEWPVMPTEFLIRENRATSMQNWNDVVSLMQVFRQGSDLGRNPGNAPNRPGRSRWPEPETIRRATSRRSSRHQRMTAIPDDAFPRAEIGLPIVFHFQSGREGDPEDTELYPVTDGVERTRMASPVILRPGICANGASFQMIMCLKTPTLQEVVLKKTTHQPHFTIIQDPKLASYAKSPMGIPASGKVERSPSGSALDAFLAFAREKGNDFKEV